MTNTEKKSNTVIDVFAVPDVIGIFNLGRPTAYRSDCQVGQFKIKDRIMGPELAMEIISIRKIAGEYFDYDSQDWLEVLFIDSNNSVSNVLFKTESIDNLLDVVKNIYAKGKPIANFIITGLMRQRQSKRLGTKYYAVDFTWKENTPERITEIKEFVGVHPELMNYSMLEEVGERVNGHEQPLIESKENLTVKKTMKMLGGKE